LFLSIVGGIIVGFGVGLGIFGKWVIEELFGVGSGPLARFYLYGEISLVVGLIPCIVGIYVVNHSLKTDTVKPIADKPIVPGKKFCRYCGTENNKDAVFCEKCGKNIM
jgi:ribosomal protein L40E